jgi:hypothetical protein
MNRVSLTLLGAFAALMALPVCAASDANSAAFAEVLGLLAARHHGHVAFTEVHRFGMLRRPLTSSGELFYDAPDHLEKRTLAPRAETLLLDHGVLTAQRGRRKHVLVLADYPQIVPFVESIRATLAGDRAGLERYFRCSFAGTAAHWTLELSPADATLARSVRSIRIEGERDAIHTVQIHETDGDTAEMTLGAALNP